MSVIMFTDLVGSVDLKQRLRALAYAALIERHDALFMDILRATPGAELRQDTGDGFYALFPTPAAAVEAALRFQRALRDEPWPEEPARVRIGLHAGQIAELSGTEADTKLVGLPIDLAARVMSLALPGQILLTRHVFDDARQYLRQLPGDAADRPALQWLAHGRYLLKGYDDPLEICEVGEPDIAPLQAPADSDKALRNSSVEEAELLGWRPAAGLPVPSHPDWRLLEKLGEGGVGEVWLASNKQLHEQHVFKFCFDADKLRTLKRELTLFRVIRKHLGERRDIAQLHDVHLDRPPYFLESDYSKHGDLVHWTDAQGGIDQVPLATRLALLAQTARAVSAAHSVGVLHKDLKPVNLLVGVDERGAPYIKLSDFGIGELAGGSRRTGGVTVVGFTEMLSEQDTLHYGATPIYAPPESLTAQPFTVQGDIYALGVMLYQMVVGDLNKPLAPGWRRDIEDELLRADIARCVDGDPQRRFASAQELAERIETLSERREQLAGERRQQQKDQRRRRLIRLGAAAMAVLLLLVGGIGVALVREQGLRKETEAAQRTSEREAAKARAVSEFLQSTLASVDPSQAQGREVTVKEVLDEAAAQFELVDNPLGHEPPVEASIRLTLGRTYRALGQLDESIEHLERALQLNRQALGENDPATLRAQREVGIAYNAAGRHAEAEQILADALERQQRLLGSGHEDTLATTLDLAIVQSFGLRQHDKAIPLFEQVLAEYRRIYGDENEETLEAMNALGIAYYYQGRYADVEPLWQKALEVRQQRLGDTHPDTTRSLNNLGLLYMRQERYADAERMYRRAIDSMVRVHGSDHPDTLSARNNLAVLYNNWGRVELARSMNQDTLETRRRVLGEEHPDTLLSLNNLADTLRRLGQYDEAEVHLLQALGLTGRTRGETHPETLRVRNNLALVYHSQLRYPESEAAFIEVLAQRIEVLGADDEDTLDTRLYLGDLYRDWRRYDEAIEQYQAVLSRLEQRPGVDEGALLLPLAKLGHVYADLEDYDRAQEHFQRALAIGAQVDPEEEDEDHRDLVKDYAEFLRTTRGSEEASSRAPPARSAGSGSDS
jgi:tetratricopeptide (TPR) repeat protein/class 3 adenylate cyclase